MMKRQQINIGSILIGKGLVSKEQLDEALAAQARSGEFLGAVLVRMGMIKEEDLTAALAEQFSVPVISIGNRYIDWELVRQFTPSLILDSRCFPTEKTDFKIVFAITNPLDAWALERAEREAAGMRTEFVMVSPSDMDKVIARYKEYMRGYMSKRFE